MYKEEVMDILGTPNGTKESSSIVNPGRWLAGKGKVVIRMDRWEYSREQLVSF